ncbi:magnesium transporter NIPA-like protein 2 [Elsinoe australis]|uniref:Magnesium transporter NIPA-like protein 2 n=1 Tax=Elsinoe australis TaxID=40998 RepID=A0A4U7AT00_9PEZI|nr:magnesium transporter NIPA-like protein 2 [Elsinoe australis]
MASLSPGGLVAVGVIVGLISTCVQSVGLTLQRKSHILEEEKAEHLPKRAPYRRRRWQIGMLLFLLSNIVGSSIQITTLPLPLLSTLQASGLVFNALLASLLLHEPFTRRTLLGTLLVAAGALLISFFSALPEPSHTLQQLLDLLVVKEFLIWFCLTLFLVLVITVLAFCMVRFMPPHRLRQPRTRLLLGMAYGLISGILSAHALLLAKSAVELLVRTIVDKKNQFGAYQSWLLLLMFLFLALTQLYYLHHGLRLVSTSILYPFVFCVYNIIAILDGLIYFRQTDRLPALHGGLIALGTIILLTGVLALSWRLSEETASDDSSSEAGIKADLPHSALTPGMGLVNEEANDVQTPLRSYFDSPTEHYRDEPSPPASPVSHFPDLTASANGAPSDLDATERDPLLAQRPRSRTSMSSNRNRRGTSARREAISRRRRSTIKEVQMVWDELRDERNWFPPSERRSPKLTSERYRDEEEGAVEEDSTPKGSRPGSREGGGKKRVAWEVEGTPTRTVEQRRERSQREKRRTAPAGGYTFENVLGAFRTSPAKNAGQQRGVKRTVSWGQGSTGSREELRGDYAAEDGTRPASSRVAAEERGRVPSVGLSEGEGGEDARRKSWTGSVKLDWWRKKRRDQGGEEGG